MENKYKTAQVAEMIGIHPNTVRLYEKLRLIPKPQRLSNGYRVFTDFHISKFKLARTALKVEVLQSGLRKKIIRSLRCANYSLAVILRMINAISNNSEIDIRDVINCTGVALRFFKWE